MFTNCLQKNCEASGVLGDRVLLPAVRTELLRPATGALEPELAVPSPPARHLLDVQRELRVGQRDPARGGEVALPVLDDVRVQVAVSEAVLGLLDPEGREGVEMPALHAGTSSTRTRNCRGGSQRQSPLSAMVT